MLFQTEPTFDDIITDIYSAAKDNTLCLMDTATATSNVSEAMSAQTILNCIQAVEDGTFSTRLDRHLSAFNVPLSKDGVIKCHPRKPPKEVLTKRDLNPIGIKSYDFS